MSCHHGGTHAQHTVVGYCEDVQAIVMRFIRNRSFPDPHAARLPAANSASCNPSFCCLASLLWLVLLLLAPALLLEIDLLCKFVTSAGTATSLTDAQDMATNTGEATVKHAVAVYASDPRIGI